MAKSLPKFGTNPQVDKLKLATRGDDDDDEKFDLNDCKKKKKKKQKRNEYGRHS